MTPWTEQTTNGGLCVPVQQTSPFQPTATPVSIPRDTDNLRLLVEAFTEFCETARAFCGGQNERETCTHSPIGPTADRLESEPIRSLALAASMLENPIVTPKTHGVSTNSTADLTGTTKRDGHSTMNVHLKQTDTGVVGEEVGATKVCTTDGQNKANNSRILDKTTSEEQKTTPSMFAELKQALKSELKSELKTELIAQLKSELKVEFDADMKTELNSQFEVKLEGELRNRLKIELKTELEAELKKTLEADLKPALMEELKGDLDAILKGELKTSLKAELKEELTEGLKTELETELKAGLKKDLKVELKTELGGELRSSLGAELATLPLPPTDPLPMPPEILCRIHGQLDLTSNIEDICFWAICLTSFLTIAPRFKFMDRIGAKNLIQEKYVFCKSTYITIYSFWNGSESAGIHIYPTNYKPLCFVEAIKNWKRVSPSKGTEFLFALPGKEAVSDHTKWWVEERLYEILNLLGCVDLYDFRSFALGGMEIAKQTNTKSDAWKTGEAWTADKALGWENSDHMRKMYKLIEKRLQV